MTTIKENPLHILVDNQVDLRRHLLLGSIDAIKSLEKYEKFKKLKNLKKKKFMELGEELKLINQDVERLVNLLPKLKEKKIEKQISRIEHKEETSKDKKTDKIKNLHHEMRIIQEKLTRLNF